MVAAACGEPVRNRPHPNGAGLFVEPTTRGFLLRLPSHRAHRFAAAALVAGFGAVLLPGTAGATTTPLTIVVSGNGPAFGAEVVVTCESAPVPSTGGVDIGGAARAERHTVAVAEHGDATLQISDLTDGTACSVTASGLGAALLDAVDGGVALVGSDGQASGVAVTVDRGTPVTAHLTFKIPVVIPAPASSSTVLDATNATGSGSAASLPPALPGSDGAASAAAPVALAAARSTTTASSAALPDPSGTGTALVIASIGVLICGAAAYALTLTRREPRAH